MVEDRNRPPTPNGDQRAASSELGSLARSTALMIPPGILLIQRMRGLRPNGKGGWCRLASRVVSLTDDYDTHILRQSAERIALRNVEQQEMSTKF